MRSCAGSKAGENHPMMSKYLATVEAMVLLDALDEVDKSGMEM